MGLCLFNINTNAQEGDSTSPSKRIFFKLHSETYSDVTSIDIFIHEFDGKFDGGDYAFTENNMELGASWGNTSLSYIWRYEHFYEFSRDLALFYNETENNLANTLERYNVQLKGEHFRGTGLKLAHTWSPMHGLDIILAGSWLRTDELIDADISGFISPTNDLLGYSGDINLGIVSDDDLLLEKPISSPSGQGYSFDLEVNWAINKSWQVAVQLQDVYSKIKWDDVLDSQLTLSTINRGISNGKINATPFLVGKQSIHDYSQKLPKKRRAQVHYRINNNYSAMWSVYDTEYFTHSRIGINSDTLLTGSLGLNWSPDTGAIGISYQNDYINFGISTDNTSIDKAHALSLNIGMYYAF